MKSLLPAGNDGVIRPGCYAALKAAAHHGVVSRIRAFVHCPPLSDFGIGLPLIELLKPPAMVRPSATELDAIILTAAQCDGVAYLEVGIGLAARHYVAVAGD